MGIIGFALMGVFGWRKRTAHYAVTQKLTQRAKMGRRAGTAR